MDLDWSLDIGPSRTDGLDRLVGRFQLDTLQMTRQHYRGVPLLRSSIRQEEKGWIDVWPEFVCARLLSVRPGPSMSEEAAKKKIIQFARTQLPHLAIHSDFRKLTFHGDLREAEELGHKVWKIESKPEKWIEQMRRQACDCLERSGLLVQGLREADSVVHIVLRGRWPNSGKEPAGVRNKADLEVTFDQIGFRPRKHQATSDASSSWHPASPAACFSTCFVTFGPSPHFYEGREGSSRMLGTSPSSAEAGTEKPPCRTLGDFPICPAKQKKKVKTAQQARLQIEQQRLRSMPEDSALSGREDGAESPSTRAQPAQVDASWRPPEDLERGRLVLEALDLALPWSPPIRHATNCWGRRLEFKGLGLDRMPLPVPFPGPMLQGEEKEGVDATIPSHHEPEHMELVVAGIPHSDFGGASSDEGIYSSIPSTPSSIARTIRPQEASLRSCEVLESGALPSLGTLTHGVKCVACKQHGRGECGLGSKCHKCHGKHDAKDEKKGGGRTRQRQAKMSAEMSGYRSPDQVSD